MSSSLSSYSLRDDERLEPLDGLSKAILVWVVAPLDRALFLLFGTASSTVAQSDSNTDNSNTDSSNSSSSKQLNAMIAIVTAVSILLIKRQFGKRHGVDWYGFVHALITGIGSVLCLYLDCFAADVLLNELHNPGQCADRPLTLLHTILPAITMGYSIFDMVDSLNMRLDFVLHGAATFTVMALFCWNDVPHLVNSMLLMEVSSIFLNLVRFHGFTPAWSLANQFCFALTFFLFRIVLVPYIWIAQVTKLLRQEQTDDYCLPFYFSKVVLILGPVFHILNAYWFYKIIRKIIRKVSGEEKLNERNDLMESEHHAPHAAHGCDKQQRQQQQHAGKKD